MPSSVKPSCTRLRTTKSPTQSTPDFSLSLRRRLRRANLILELHMSKPTHTRIRMFNTKDTYPNQTLDNDLCQAVRAGNTVYVRGQVGTDFDGNLVGLGDPRAQAEQAMRNVKQLLEEAGSDMSHIVKTTTYLIDPRYREAVYGEVGKWLKGVFPISTGLVVSALGQPQWLMEIDVIAVIPE
jgi:enamine deaminase RidA (YjgF/YER057c/UK114 family)